MLAKSNPDEAKRLLALAQEDVAERWKRYDYLAHEPVNGSPAPQHGAVEVKK